MKIKSASFLILLLSSFAVYAGSIMPIIVPATLIPGSSTPGISKSNTDTQNRVYAGLIWTLKDKTSWIPDLTFGFRSLRVKSNDSVNGGDVSTRIKLSNGIAVDSVVLSYVGGNRDILGNVGAGYSLTNTSFLGTVGVQGQYARIGTDFQFTDKRFTPYLELLTIDKQNNVSRTITSGTSTPASFSCPPGYVLNGSTCSLPGF